MMLNFSQVSQALLGSIVGQSMTTRVTYHILLTHKLFTSMHFDSCLILFQCILLFYVTFPYSSSTLFFGSSFFHLSSTPLPLPLPLHYSTLHNTTLHYTSLHYTSLHYTTLHYTTLHYTTLHYTTLHFTQLLTLHSPLSTLHSIALIII